MWQTRRAPEGDTEGDAEGETLKRRALNGDAKENAEGRGDRSGDAKKTAKGAQKREADKGCRRVTPKGDAEGRDVIADAEEGTQEGEAER